MRSRFTRGPADQPLSTQRGSAARSSGARSGKQGDACTHQVGETRKSPSAGEDAGRGRSRAAGTSCRAGWWSLVTPRACHLSPPGSTPASAPPRGCTWAPPAALLREARCAGSARAPGGATSAARTPLRQRRTETVTRSELFNSTEPVMEINTDAYRPLIHTHTHTHTSAQEARSKSTCVPGGGKRTRVRE